MHPDNCVPNDESNRVASDDYEREQFCMFPRDDYKTSFVAELNDFLFTRLPPTMTLADADRTKHSIWSIVREAWQKHMPRVEASGKEQPK